MWSSAPSFNEVFDVVNKAHRLERVIFLFHNIRYRVMVDEDLIIDYVIAKGSNNPF